MAVTDVEILMVDDDPLDFELFRRSLAKQSISKTLHYKPSGEEALAFLRHRDPANPLIVLMDINMPGMNGIECLEEIRQDPLLRSTTVFMLTTSEADADVAKAHELNAAGYLVKGSIGTAFVEQINLLENNSPGSFSSDDIPKMN
ncbi:MAG: response regulator [Pseudomonadota bacterium]